MVYNTNDGSTLVIKDLSSSPKPQAEYQLAPKNYFNNPMNQDSVKLSKQLPIQKDSYFRDKDQAKTLSSTKAFRKS